MASSAKTDFVDVQLRNQQGMITRVPGFEAAFQAAVKDPTVWKVSFFISLPEQEEKEHTRLIRKDDGLNSWENEPFRFKEDDRLDSSPKDLRLELYQALSAAGFNITSQQMKK
jgi:hypothetical protein